MSEYELAYLQDHIHNLAQRTLLHLTEEPTESLNLIQYLEQGFLQSKTIVSGELRLNGVESWRNWSQVGTIIFCEL